MNTPLTEKHSRAIRIAVCLATVLVVMRHGQNLHHFYPGGSPWIPAEDFNIFIQRFIFELTAVAIPFFFTVSGFLFFVGLDDCRSLFQKLRRRVDSLLIPFLLWNVLFILLWTLVYGLVPPLREQLVHSYGISFDVSWFAKRFTVDPIVGQFWYIRTLIVFCLFTPLMLLSFRSRIVSVLILALLMQNWQAVDCRLFSTEGMSCFYLGGLIGYNRWHEEVCYNRCSWLLLPVIAGLIANDILRSGFPGNWYLRILLTMIFLVQFSLYLAEKGGIGAWFSGMNRYSFFIYAVHADLLAALSLTLGRIVPHTPLNSFLLYGFCVSAVILFSIAAAAAVRKLTPRFYGVLTGGR